jgi:hypothetical protein
MADEQVKECFKIEDDPEAMACIKQAVRVADGPCKPRIVLLVKEGCSGCAEEKQHYSQEISDGTIKLLDIETKEGFEVAKRNQILGVPALLILDCRDNAIV